MIISTGVMSFAFSLVISPICFIFGKCLLVIEIAFLSISLAHSGVMPYLLADSGNTPIPSNRLPSVISSFILFHLLSYFDYLILSMKKAIEHIYGKIYMKKRRYFYITSL